jgi:RTX calcium-binding nonapeptide repeat (4 copies)
MRTARHLLLVAIGLAMASALSGCAVITAQDSQQLNLIGAVRLTTTVCFSQQPGCADKGNSDTGSGPGFQVLIGYRIPQSTSSPQEIVSSAGQPLTLSRDPSYGAELERLSPAGPDAKWVGYRSAGIAVTPAPSFTVSPSFALRQGPNGEPFTGPFSYRVVTGARVTPSSNANAPVDCGPDLRGNSANKTACVDSPSIGDLATALQQPTQDLGIADYQSAQRSARGTVEPVLFRVLYAGRGGSAPTFDLRATTDVPGADVSTHPGNLTPTAGATKVRVGLRIPPDTPRGSYDVTLVASLPNGQTRSRTEEIQIGTDPGRCGSAKPTIRGTPGDDRLVGTDGRDVISGFGGADRISGGAGNDLICAGPGDDRVRGGAGGDLLVGGRGKDVLIGGRGRDRFKH